MCGLYPPSVTTPAERWSSPIRIFCSKHMQNRGCSSRSWNTIWFTNDGESVLLGHVRSRDVPQFHLLDLLLGPAHVEVIAGLVGRPRRLVDEVVAAGDAPLPVCVADVLSLAADAAAAGHGEKGGGEGLAVGRYDGPARVKSAPLLTASVRFCAGLPTYASTKCVPSPENSWRNLLRLSSSPLSSPPLDPGVDSNPDSGPDPDPGDPHPPAHRANVSRASSSRSSSRRRCKPRSRRTDDREISGRWIRSDGSDVAPSSKSSGS
ncbi:hypothetical protein ACHAWF_017860 [Thalassiosira exigua]